MTASNPFEPPASVPRTPRDGPIHTPPIATAAGLVAIASGITVGVAGLQGLMLLGGPWWTTAVPVAQALLAVPIAVGGGLMSRGRATAVLPGLLVLTPVAIGSVGWAFWLLIHGVLSPLQGLAAVLVGTALALWVLAVGPVQATDAARRALWTEDAA